MLPISPKLQDFFKENWQSFGARNDKIGKAIFTSRCLTGLTTSALTQGLEDPIGFLKKLAMRFHIEFFYKLLSKASPKNKKPNSLGEPSQEAQETKNPFLARALFSQGLILQRPLPFKQTLKPDCDNPRHANPHYSPATEELFDPYNLSVLFYLTNSLPHTQSGYTLRTHALLNSLAETGVRAEAITRPHYPLSVGRIPQNQYEDIEGIRYWRHLPWVHSNSELTQMAHAVKSIKKHANSRQVQILHTTTDYRNGLAVATAAHDLRIPWVYEMRGKRHQTWLASVPKEFRKTAERSEYYIRASALEVELARAANGVITLSDIHRNELISQGVSPERILTLPNSVDDSWLETPFLNRSEKRQLRRSLGLKPDAFIFGSVTSVVDYEGLDLLVRALPQLPKHCHLLIVGDGQALSSLRDLARKLGVEDRATFPGSVPNQQIKHWYQSLDQFVVPRRNHEVCRNVTPLKATQAQALGIPVIAADLPALHEATGGYATFTPPEDLSALVSALRSLSLSTIDNKAEPNHPALNQANTKEMREFAATRTWTLQGIHLNTFYRKILSLTRDAKRG